MKYKWLNKKENFDKLAVIFNGWGISECVFENITKGDYNVLFFYDYTEPSFDFSQIGIQKYQQKYLICWSMGVYVSSLFSQYFQNFDKKIAINGTLKIIDDKNGIPEKIYESMINNLNEENFSRFVKKVFNYNEISDKTKIDKDINELKNELINIGKIKLTDTIKFDKVIISKNDRIIPAKNQINYWKDKIEYTLIDAAHCPFYEYKSIQDII